MFGNTGRSKGAKLLGGFEKDTFFLSWRLVMSRKGCGDCVGNHSSAANVKLEDVTGEAMV